jgi:hypothetical protein
VKGAVSGAATHIRRLETVPDRAAPIGRVVIVGDARVEMVSNHVLTRVTRLGRQPTS